MGRWHNAYQQFMAWLALRLARPEYKPKPERIRYIPWVKNHEFGSRDDHSDYFRLAYHALWGLPDQPEAETVKTDEYILDLYHADEAILKANKLAQLLASNLVTFDEYVHEINRLRQDLNLPPRNTDDVLEDMDSS